MVKRILGSLAGFFACAAAAAAPDELVMIAPTNQTMPLAEFHNDVLTGGIIKDLSEAIGERIGRRTRFISVAGDQVSAVMKANKADGICYVRPFWIDGAYHWSRPLIPDAELVAARIGAPVIRSLRALRDRPVGTVTSYRYPRVEQVLGLRFQRSDSATMEENLRKVAAGKPEYTILSQSTLAYQMRINTSLKLRPDIVFASFSAQCAFTRSGRVVFKDIDRAINGLVEDGTMERILAQYR